jgi:hypothetical protein
VIEPSSFGSCLEGGIWARETDVKFMECIVSFAENVCSDKSCKTYHTLFYFEKKINVYTKMA